MIKNFLVCYELNVWICAGEIFDELGKLIEKYLENFFPKIVNDYILYGYSDYLIENMSDEHKCFFKLLRLQIQNSIIECNLNWTFRISS